MSRINKEEQNKRIKMAVETFITAFIGTIVVYLILGPFNNTCVELLNYIDANNSELDIAICVLPILFIFLFMIRLGMYIVSNNNSNKK